MRRSLPCKSLPHNSQRGSPIAKLSMQQGDNSSSGAYSCVACCSSRAGAEESVLSSAACSCAESAGIATVSPPISTAPNDKSNPTACGASASCSASSLCMASGSPSSPFPSSPSSSSVIPSGTAALNEKSSEGSSVDDSASEPSPKEKLNEEKFWFPPACG